MGTDTAAVTRLGIAAEPWADIAAAMPADTAAERLAAGITATLADIAAATPVASGVERSVVVSTVAAVADSTVAVVATVEADTGNRPAKDHKACSSEAGLRVLTGLWAELLRLCQSHGHRAYSFGRVWMGEGSCACCHLLQAQRVRQKPTQPGKQAMGSEVGFEENLCRSGPSHHLRIATLMVVSGERERNEHSRFACGAEFGNGGSSAAREDKIRSLELPGHVVEKGRDPPAIRSRSAGLVSCQSRYGVAATSLMQDGQPRNLLQQRRNNLRHGVVQNTSALAAPKNKQAPGGSRGTWRQLKKLGAHRNAGDLRVAEKLHCRGKVDGSC
jgi:hypothetical protein